MIRNIFIFIKIHPIVSLLIVLLLLTCIFLTHEVYNYKDPKTNNTLRLKAKKQLMDEFFTQDVINKIIKDYESLKPIRIEIAKKYDDKIKEFIKLITIYYGISHLYNNERYFDSDGDVDIDVEKCIYKFIINNVLLNFPLIETKTDEYGIYLKVKY